MQEKHYSQIQETIYHEKIDNGLEVFLIPKPGFHKTYALLHTKFGSIDHHFIPRGKTEPVRMPDGIAHFLEHKLFEKEAGDVFHLFGKLGASANAFTSFTRTGYLFSTTSHLEENLKTLLDFVQEPYFTEQTVEKEKGIIAQEIQMYEDEPDWRAFLGLLGNLYSDQPMQIDIAGTVESIQEVTPELLYENYNTFYHPDNMQLVLTGKLDPEETMAFIRENQAQKTFASPEPIQRIYPEEDLEKIVPRRNIHLPVRRPKVLVGVRGNIQPTQPSSSMKQRLEMEILMELLLGPTSANYLRLYDQGLIDDSFSSEFTYEEYFDFVLAGGDSKKPERLEKELKTILLHAADSEELTEENFHLVKKRMIGQLLQALNSPEYIADHFIDFYEGDRTLFDLIPLLESITLKDVRQAAVRYMEPHLFSSFFLLPLSNKEGDE